MTYPNVAIKLAFLKKSPVVHYFLVVQFRNPAFTTQPALRSYVPVSNHLQGGCG